MTRRFVLVTTALVLLVPAAGWAADQYVLAGGSGSGTSWSDARGDLPYGTTYCSRGDTIWVGDGEYTVPSGQMRFRVAASGTTPIYFKKATASAHGTETGWSSTYGDGVAEIEGTVRFMTDYWVVDGQTGSGKTGHGFKFTAPAANCSAQYWMWYGDADVSHITISHSEFEHCGSGLNYEHSIIRLSGTGAVFTDWTLSYCYMHGVSKVMLLYVEVTDSLVEHCYFYDRDYYDNPDPADNIHGEAISWNNEDDTSNVTIRYNTFENIKGTGVVVIKDGDQGGFAIYGNVFFNSNADYTTSNATISNSGGDTNFDMLVYNNTFVDLTGSTGVLWYCGASACTGSDDDTNITENNLFVNCGTPIFNGDTDAYNTTSGSTSLFTNYAGDDFTLASATDAGHALSSPYDEDMDGVSRGDDSVWDRGAYEYEDEEPEPNTCCCGF